MRAASLLAIAAVGVLAYSHYQLLTSVSLPCPNKPPFFSVSYLVGSGSPAVPGALLLADLPLHREQIANDMETIRAAGFDGVKLWFYFRQDNTVSYWTAKRAARTSLYPIGLLAGHNGKPAGQPFSEQELLEWERFVRTQVRATRDFVYFWEVWNEPDIQIFRYGSPAEYAELLKRSCTVIKQENPHAKVVVAIGAADRQGLEYLRQLLALGGGEYIDILGVHPYAANPYIRKDVFNQSLRAIKNIAREHGNRWPLWITEIGQPTSEVSDELQAQLAEFVFQRAYEENIPVIWYHYSDKGSPGSPGTGMGWGLLRADDTPRPVFQRLQAFLGSHPRDSSPPK